MCGWRIAGGLGIVGLVAGLCGAGPEDEHYSPVSPPLAIHVALRSSLKTVRNWVEDRDFASTSRDAQGLTALAHLYVYQGDGRAWREKTADLLTVSSRLSAAARNKDTAACTRIVRECDVLLDDLARLSPGGPKVEKEFKLRGGLTTWMLLLDAAYSDAKTSRDCRELEQLALAVAEESNAARHLRADARWRRMFADVRQSALDVAGRAKAGDLVAAKAALKNVYRRCDACHDQSRKR